MTPKVYSLSHFNGSAPMGWASTPVMHRLRGPERYEVDDGLQMPSDDPAYYFLNHINFGIVPHGSVLVVDLPGWFGDRSARRAVRVLTDIQEAGVSVVIGERMFAAGDEDGNDYLAMYAMVTEQVTGKSFGELMAGALAS